MNQLSINATHEKTDTLRACGEKSPYKRNFTVVIEKQKQQVSSFSCNV